MVISRRGFLGAAVAGVLWAGCGRDDARREPPSDAAVLRGVLGREAAAAGAAAGVVARQDAEHLSALAARAGVAAPDPVAAAATPSRSSSSRCSATSTRSRSCRTRSCGCS